jgi:hypothetical protein
MTRRGAAVLRCVYVHDDRARVGAVPLKEMAVKEEKIEVEGEAVEALPGTMFRVQPDAILPGDLVEVEFSIRPVARPHHLSLPLR